jgi:hypothetical protein
MNRKIPSFVVPESALKLVSAAVSSEEYLSEIANVLILNVKPTKTKPIMDLN